MRAPPAFGTAEQIERAVILARQLQERASGLQTTGERRQQAELDRMLQTPGDKATLIQLTDQCFRSKTAARVAKQFTHILDVQGVPRFFSPLDRALLRGFQTFGGWLPGVAVPLVKEHMQQETANVVLPAETDVLIEHLRARQDEGLRMNVNFLGEALLGETEAERRLANYLAALAIPEVEVLSVKISTIYSQISSLAWEHTIETLSTRLEQLYREAQRHRFKRRDGSEAPKFIYLDMEEYRDLRLTAEAFMRTLERPGLEQVSGGIALQAYIPDSAQVQGEINAWARRRVEKGGAPVTIRLVKGANLEMERVEAAVRNWPQAPFKTKAETDANFKRMLHEALRPENLCAVRIGIASHNLFDIAYGLTLASEIDAGSSAQFEMLEGMANHQRRAVLEQSRHLLLYAPACRKEEFINAIGYLIRRLDENTGRENFLRYAFNLTVDGEEWQQLENAFRHSFQIDVTDQPRRSQNRLSDIAVTSPNRFSNEADTDFSLPANVEWARQIVSRWEPRYDANALQIPMVLDGEEVSADRTTRESHDPSRPNVVVARYSEAREADVEQAVACAKNDPDGWRKLSHDARTKLLLQVAAEIRRARGDLIGAAIAEGGKIITEADPEVSEAIDFLEFYPRSAKTFFESPSVAARGCGTVVVVPPWNFPIAIPCGGIAAALAAGNTVILKPASPTVLIAWELCQCFWRAGVSRRILQFLPCSGSGVGSRLVQHPDVNAVILTGGTATALQILEAKPELRLFAETGGKNAMIVTAMSDREQAIKHAVHSAFSHSGQKCSATSLLLLEAEVYDDPEFQRILCDAVESMHVGSAWERHTRIGPLIRPPSGDLERALTQLEPGESWAVTPCRVGQNPNLWSPGIKYGAQPGSYTHLTEFFGPLLGVMRYERLEEAVALVNRTGYGLTSGIQSLDDREITFWKEHIRAGNLYINKPTVGAIVLRQPFGGYGKSSFGPGMKAGGPNYVAQLMEFEDRPAPPKDDHVDHPRLEQLRLKVRGKCLEEKELPRLLGAIESYDHWRKEEFTREHDEFRLLGEDNLRRYLAVREIRVRVHPDDTFFEIFARACAAKAAGSRVTISSPPGTKIAAVATLDQLTDVWAAGIEFVEETDEQLTEAVRSHQMGRIRFASRNRVPAAVRKAAIEAGTSIIDTPVLAAGRVELLWYLREQSVSSAYHRYGNLGSRTCEKRTEPS